MRFLALVSSYRKNGNTARVVRMITDHLATLAGRLGEPVEVETVNLAHASLMPCRGCRACFDRGESECPVHDDLAAIKARMQAADGLLVGSPVYVEDVNGVMKTWIDRLAHVNHRPEFAGKYAYVIATSGLRSSGHALRTMSLALHAWGYYVVGQARFVTGALMAEEALAARYAERARQVAADLAQAVRDRRAERPGLVPLLFFKVQQAYWQKNADDSIDYAYWLARGWTAPRQSYYIPHRAGWGKVAVARLVGGAIAPFVT